MYLTNDPWEPLKSKRPGYTLRTSQYTLHTSPSKVVKLRVHPQRYENSDGGTCPPSPALTDETVRSCSEPSNELNTSLRGDPRNCKPESFVNESPKLRSSRKRITMSKPIINLPSVPNDSQSQVCVETVVKESGTCAKHRKRKCLTMRKTKKNVNKSNKINNTTITGTENKQLIITNHAIESAEESVDNMETQDICEAPIERKKLQSSNKLSFDLWHPKHVKRNHKFFNELDVCMSTYMNIVNKSIQNLPVHDTVLRNTLDMHRRFTRKRMMNGILLGYTLEQLDHIIN